MRHVMLTVALLVGTPAKAFFVEEIMAGSGHYTTGQMLYAMGRSSQQYLAYVVATVDADATSQRIDGNYCIPEGVVIGQLADVVSTYLDEVPEKRHLNAAYLVRMSYRKAFPCPPVPKKAR